MMSFRDNRVSRHDLRLFGIGLGLFLGMIGTVIVWRGYAAGQGFWLLGVCVVALFWRDNSWTRTLYVIWMRVGGILARIVVTIMLFFLYLLLLTPIAMITRLAKKNFLSLGYGVERDSFWEECSRDCNSKELERQS